MRTRKASDLQADVYALLDEASSGTPKPGASDVLESLNQQWTRVYRKLIKCGSTWNMQTATFATQAGKDTYGVSDSAFGATYWATKGVDVQIDGLRWKACHRFQFEQRNDYQLSTWSWPWPVLYDVWGGTADATGTDGTVLKFITTPTAATSARHFWFPAPQRLVNSNDVFDGIAGAERAMVYLTASEMAIALEQFELGSAWAQKGEAFLEEILADLRDRNIGEAPTARLVRGRPTLWRTQRAGWLTR